MKDVCFGAKPERTAGKSRVQIYYAGWVILFSFCNFVQVKLQYLQFILCAKFRQKRIAWKRNISPVSRQGKGTAPRQPGDISTLHGIKAPKPRPREAAFPYGQQKAPPWPHTSSQGLGPLKQARPREKGATAQPPPHFSLGQIWESIYLGFWCKAVHGATGAGP